MTCFYWHYYNR